MDNVVSGGVYVCTHVCMYVMIMIKLARRDACGSLATVAVGGATVASEIQNIASFLKVIFKFYIQNSILRPETATELHNRA